MKQSHKLTAVEWLMIACILAILVALAIPKVCL